MVWLNNSLKNAFKTKKHVSFGGVLPFSISISCAKVCGGENGGSGGGKLCKVTLVIRLASKPKLIKMHSRMEFDSDDGQNCF